MVKRKKKSTRLATQGFGRKNLDAELRRVKAVVLKQDWSAACQILEPLSQQYPQEKRVWEYLTDVSFEAGKTTLYQKACEGLFAADPTGENAFMLGGAYLKNMHPLLALQAFRQVLERDPDHKLASEARDTIKKLEPMLEEVLAEMGLSEAAGGMEIALLHERGQAYLGQGDAAAARAAEEEVLARHPEFLSARNNLSLISWMEGDVDGAIATAQDVLEREADNIHALSNLIRFWVISGNDAAARPYGERLKTSQAKAWDGWTKKVEGLSYLADDAAVVDVWRQAQAAGVEGSPASSLFYHLSAVSLARLGDEKQAISQWKKALEETPGYQLARENLNDIRKPIGQRHGAWPLSWEQWLTPKSSAELHQVITTKLRSTQPEKLISGLKDFLNRHPDVMAILPRILERGGPKGQEFILANAEQLKTPELLALIKDFALSQNGPDQMRNRAATLASQANLLPKANVTLWVRGEWRDVMLMAYEFHGEPITEHSKPVEQLLGQALHRLRQDDAKQAVEAEALLSEALELEPEAPDLQHNLAIAFKLQGREEDSNALTRDIVSRCPDYLFASASLAQIHLNEGDIEAAEALLHPFLCRDRFHFLEFSTFADAYIELLVAKKQKDGARTWLQVWEKVNSEDPTLQYWKQRLGHGQTLPQL